MPVLRVLKIRYWPLIKSLQTALLLTTGLAGYMSSRCPILHWKTLLGLTASLFLAISGSTVLNMWHDRDIDARMRRTCGRPLPSGNIRPGEALGLGLVLSGAGVGWALMMDPRYGVIIFAGLFFDVVVYTLWLKRRTWLNIILGGLAGSFAVLAGAAAVDPTLAPVPVILAVVLFLWTPPHFWSLAMVLHEQYREAGVPMLPVVVGDRKAAQVIFGHTLVLVTHSLAVSGIADRVLAIEAGRLGSRTEQLSW